MQQSKSKAGTMSVVIYLSLVIAALLFALLNLTKSAFAALYLVILTLPWSLGLSGLLDTLGIQGSVPDGVKLLILVGFGGINASFIYFATRQEVMR